MISQLEGFAGIYAGESILTGPKSFILRSISKE